MHRRLAAVLLACLAFGAAFAAAAANPQLAVNSPTEGQSIDGTSVTIEFEVSDFSVVPSTVPLSEAGNRPDANVEGEGHLHFMLDLMPVIVWESTEPYTLEDVPPGEHTLMIELVNNDHSPLASPVSQQIRFQTTSAQILANTGGGDTQTRQLNLFVILIAGTALLGTGMVLRRKVA